MDETVFYFKEGFNDENLDVSLNFVYEKERLNTEIISGKNKSKVKVKKKLFLINKLNQIEQEQKIIDNAYVKNNIHHHEEERKNIESEEIKKNVELENKEKDKKNKTQLLKQVVSLQLKNQPFCIIENENKFNDTENIYSSRINIRQQVEKQLSINLLGIMRKSLETTKEKNKEINNLSNLIIPKNDVKMKQFGNNNSFRYSSKFCPNLSFNTESINLSINETIKVNKPKELLKAIDEKNEFILNQMLTTIKKRECKYNEIKLTEENKFNGTYKCQMFKEMFKQNFTENSVDINNKEWRENRLRLSIENKALKQRSERDEEKIVIRRKKKFRMKLSPMIALNI